MLDKFEAILFDCDGTLVDTEYTNALTIVETLKQGGWGEVTIEYVFEHWMGRSNDFILTALRENINPEIPQHFFDLSTENGLKLLPKTMGHIEGALLFVKELVALKKPIAVASNGNTPNVVASLEAGGFLPYIPVQLICTRPDVQLGKPSPQLYLLAAERLSVQIKNCLVLEDSPTGTESGVAAEATVWGFNGTAHNKEKVKNGLVAKGAKRVFGSYAEIAETLGIELAKQAA